jgi:hypothetical protein
VAVAATHRERKPYAILEHGSIELKHRFYLLEKYKKQFPHASRGSACSGA